MAPLIWKELKFVIGHMQFFFFFNSTEKKDNRRMLPYAPMTWVRDSPSYFHHYRHLTKYIVIQFNILHLSFWGGRKSCFMPKKDREMPPVIGLFWGDSHNDWHWIVGMLGQINVCFRKYCILKLSYDDYIFLIHLSNYLKNIK